MRKFLFPYESIKKDSNIIIYGAGDVGKQFIVSLAKTQYCNVLCVLDKNYEEKTAFPVKVLPPEKIIDIDENNYSIVLIAINSIEMSKKIEQYLIELGVSENKILSFDNSFVSLPFMKQENILYTDDRDKLFRLAIVSIGGLGDDLISSVLLKVFRKILIERIVIDFYCTTPKLFYTMPFINNVYNEKEYFEYNNSKYDAVMVGGNFWQLEKINLTKAKRFSQLLYDYFSDMIWHYNNVFNIEDSAANSKLLQYCHILGKDRWEQHNMHNILPLNKFTKPYMDINPKSFKILSNTELENKQYITLCNSVHRLHPNSSKLWPNEYFNVLVKMLKQYYPNIIVVCIGDSTEQGAINYADMDLRGKTTFDEMVILLKYSILHIGCEGGLIHLKKFLNGKSVCLFGPTSIKTYGYDENINIRSNSFPNCENGCEWITKMWLAGICLLDYKSKYAKCMESLNPEYVYARISEYISCLQLQTTFSEKILNIVELSDLFTPNSEVALIKLAGEDTILQYASKVKNFIVYEDKLCSYDGVTSEYGNIYNIPANDEQFDIVVNFTLAQEENSHYALREMLRVTKPDGAIVINGDNENSLKLLKKEVPSNE